MFQPANLSQLHIIHLILIKPFLKYLPSIMRKQYVINIFFEKECELYLIKFSTSMPLS